MRVPPHENVSTAPTLHFPQHHCTKKITPQHEDMQNAFPTSRKRKPHRIANIGKHSSPTVQHAFLFPRPPPQFRYSTTNKRGSGIKDPLAGCRSKTKCSPQSSLDPRPRTRRASLKLSQLAVVAGKHVPLIIRGGAVVNSGGPLASWYHIHCACERPLA
jgi:hypothetical protein